MISVKLGDRLKKLREDRGLTQADVCNSLHIAQSTLANYETNFRIPKMDALGIIADYYGVSVDYLLGRTDSPFMNNQKTPKDLNKFLQQQQIMFDGDAYHLDDEEREMVMQSLRVAFYAAKKANKRKKDDSKK